MAFHSLNALSAGQSILLGIFGTLLRYGDMASPGSSLVPADIEGICLVDEIDAHIHVDMQSKILPKLIRIFPRIQFIITNHSPLFVLGMEREFGLDGVQVIEMPSGLPVAAESYVEFGKALELMSATRAFTARAFANVKSADKPIVYVEGETDAPYLKCAAKLLSKVGVIEKCDIEWIGAIDENGQAFNTGKDALKHALSIFRANPGIVGRRILLLHDNDSSSPELNYDGLWVRKIPKSINNTKIRAGIENLLKEDCIEDRFYEEKTKTKDNGDIIITRVLKKSELCEYLCVYGEVDDFSEFESAIQIIEDFLQSGS